MEAEYEMELKDLRHQLKRVHSKDTKQEDYVSTKCSRSFIILI